MMFPIGIFADAGVRAATTCSTSAAVSIQPEVKAFAIVEASTNETRTSLPRSLRELSTLRISMQTNQRAGDQARTRM